MLKTPTFTQEQLAFVKANKDTMSRHEIAEKLGMQFWIVANNMSMLGITRRQRHAPKPIELYSLCPILGIKWWNL